MRQEPQEAPEVGASLLRWRNSEVEKTSVTTAPGQ